MRSNALITVTGTHNFGALGIYAVSGRASITSTQTPGDPCSIFTPIDPCRVLTIATVLRASPPGGGNSCSFTGTTTQTVAVADTYSVDAIVLPPNPILPPNPVVPTDPCGRWRLRGVRLRQDVPRRHRPRRWLEQALLLGGLPLPRGAPASLRRAPALRRRRPAGR